MRSFLEVHYYEGGIRHETISEDGTRPEWALEPDAVGFRNEFRIDDDAVVVELARAEHSGKVIDWLGIYFRSQDGDFGDRGNHAGVGIWLCDQKIVAAYDLIHGLHALAMAVAKDGPSEGLKRQMQKFLTGPAYVPSYLCNSEGFPRL